MNQNITIHRISTLELSELLQLSRQTFFDAFAAVNDPLDMEIYATEAFRLDKLRSELQHPHSHFYFAVLDNEPVGYLKLNTKTAQTEFRDSDSLEIERIYILQKHQGKKYGGQLFNFAIATARQLNCSYVWLGVWEHNQNAIRFYNRQGFTKFSSHYFMLGNDKQTDVLMKLDLTQQQSQS